MKKQAGFTLIELIMVIVIMGVLAATALPKFVSMGSDAREAAMKGVEGAMRSTNAMIYAKAAVKNQTAATGSVTIGSATVNTAYGFAKTVADLKSVMDTSSEFTIGGTEPAAYIQHTGATVKANCSVTYTAATVDTATGLIVTPPVYALDSSGC